MLSSLNERLLAEIRELLRQEPASQGRVKDELLSVTGWTLPLVGEVTDALIASPPTEENIRALYYWGRFLFSRLKQISDGTEAALFYDLVHMIDLMFKYLSRPTQIPFRYWEDIAPRLLDEVRRFRSQPKGFDKFFEQDMSAQALAQKDEWLSSNPATAELYERWTHENMFG